MTLRNVKIQPGHYVIMRTVVSGNVSYQRRELGRKRLEDGAINEAWETDKLTRDPREYERAIKVRSKCRGLITGICSATTFALLCPTKDVPKLEAAIAEGDRLAREFNESAKLTRIEFNVMKAEIESNDQQFVRAMNADIRKLMNEMESGLRSLDVKRVRDAANKARDLGQMLEPAVNEQVTKAITAARQMARKIAKAGTTVAIEMDAETMRKLTDVRREFLDIDANGLPVPSEPMVDSRVVDFAPGNRSRTEKNANAIRSYNETYRPIDITKANPDDFVGEPEVTSKEIDL